MGLYFTRFHHFLGYLGGREYLHTKTNVNNIWVWQRIFTYENKRKHIFISEADEGFCEKLLELYDPADSTFLVLQELSFYPLIN